MRGGELLDELPARAVFGFVAPAVGGESIWFSASGAGVAVTMSPQPVSPITAAIARIAARLRTRCTARRMTTPAALVRSDDQGVRPKMAASRRVQG